MRDTNSEGASHWLQNKDKVVLDDEGIILSDFVFINNVFLDGNGQISTEKNFVPLLQVK